MSIRLRHDTPCAACGQTLPAGSRADRLPTSRDRYRLTSNDAARCVRPVSAEQPERPTSLPATDRQIVYAEALWHRDPGSAGCALAHLRTLDRAQLSAWIDSQRRLSEDL